MKLSIFLPMYGQGDLLETTSMEIWWGFHLFSFFCGKSCLSMQRLIKLSTCYCSFKGGGSGKKGMQTSPRVSKIHFPFQLASILMWIHVHHWTKLVVCWAFRFTERLCEAQSLLLRNHKKALFDPVTWRHFESHISSFIPSPKSILCSMYILWTLFNVRNATPIQF